MTLRLGTIGTNWITKMFAEAALLTGHYSLQAIYSRHQESGATFANNFAGQQAVYTDLDAFLTSGLDVVYIASPNSLHYEQAKAVIEHDINVIVEKSIFSNSAEYEDIYQLLQAHPKVHLFEGARHIYTPNFKAIEEKVAQMPVIAGANFVYEKYSSRFDAYLAGKEPNVLTREFSAGALTDLGVYPIYAALKLFGLPKEQVYFATLLKNGADGRGTAVLRYPNFDVTAQFGKMSNSYAPSEILGRRDTLMVDNIGELGEVTYYDGEGNVETLTQPRQVNPMLGEAEEFAKIMRDPDQYQAEYEQMLLLSQQVNLVLTALRQSAGIVFPADER